MCGRYDLHSDPETVVHAFGLADMPAYKPRYNIAPFSQVPIIRKDGAALVRWGLIPHWTKADSRTLKLHNARVETIAVKPSFRDAYRKRRCIVPANGFFEWKTENGIRQPYYIHPLDAELFAFAGLWELWNGPQGPLETCTIVTTAANAKMSEVEERMPAILTPGERANWLAGTGELPAPCADSMIGIRKVSRAVNDARKDYPGLLDPDSS